MEPVAETHHPHVLLECTKKKHRLKESGNLITPPAHTEARKTYLELPFFFLHHSSYYVEGGVGEA